MLPTAIPIVAPNPTPTSNQPTSIPSSIAELAPERNASAATVTIRGIMSALLREMKKAIINTSQTREAFQMDSVSAIVVSKALKEDEQKKPGPGPVDSMSPNGSIQAPKIFPRRTLKAVEVHSTPDIEAQFHQ